MVGHLPSMQQAVLGDNRLGVSDLSLLLNLFVSDRFIEFYCSRLVHTAVKTLFISKKKETLVANLIRNQQMQRDKTAKHGVYSNSFL
jgi:hypothetical protein